MVRQVLRLQAKKTKVTVLDFVNLGSYLHLTLKIPHREAYTTFIRSVSGLIARKALKVERGPALKRPRSSRQVKQQTIFWEFRPLTQILDADSFLSVAFRRMKAQPNLARVLSSQLWTNTDFSSA